MGFLDIISKFGAFIIVLLNMVISVIGIAVLAVSILILTNASLVTERIKPVVESANAALQNAKIDIKLDPADLKMGDYFSSIIYAFIAFSVITLFISLCGCMGACCKIKCLLISYIVLMIIILGVTIAMASILSTGNTLQIAQDALLSDLKANYGGIDKRDPSSVFWTAMMSYGQCCGVLNYMDFRDAKSWKMTRTIKLGKSDINVTLDMPLACCDKDVFKQLSEQVASKPGSVKEGPSPDHPANQLFMCAKLNSTNNYKNEGCYPKIWSYLQRLSSSAGFVVGMVIACSSMALVIVFATLLLRPPAASPV